MRGARLLVALSNYFLCQSKRMKRAAFDMYVQDFQQNVYSYELIQ